MEDIPFDFDIALPWSYRPFLAIVGVLLVALPFYAFQRHLFSAHLLNSVLFGALSLISWAAAAGFLHVACFSRHQKWRFADNRITIVEQTLLNTWQTDVVMTNLATTSVRQCGLGRNSNAHRVVLTQTDGTVLETRDFKSHYAAEKARQRILAYLSHC